MQSGIGGDDACCYDVGAPAALFENIKGYPQEFRAPLGASKKRGHSLFVRSPSALSLPPSASAKEIMRTYLQRRENLIKPIVVGTGPCKENIMKGADVDVLEFLIPLIHGAAGGRYIGTCHTVIAKDPDSSRVNWGMYRLMVHDRDTLGCLFPLQ